MARIQGSGCAPPSRPRPAPRLTLDKRLWPHLRLRRRPGCGGSCAHSDLPARYRDTPGYHCTYCSYTVCVGCFPLTKLDDQSRVTRTAAPSLTPSSAAPASSVTAEMDWLDAVIASPATAVRSGGAVNSAHQGHATPAAYKGESTGDGYGRTSQQRHLKENAAARGAPTTSTTSTVAAPLRCHLCRRGDLVREEALLHEWCCEGPAPASRLHSSGSLVYGTANLHKYHFMRAQQEKRRSSTEPLLARVLAVFPATLVEAGARADDGTLPCVVQSPLKSRHRSHGGSASGEKALRARDPLPSAPPVHGRRRTLSRLDAEASSAYNLRDGAALPPLDRCEEGGSFIISVWNPRTEVPLVWCAVNRMAREDAPALHHHDPHRTAGHSGRGVLPPSASVTPLFTWRCPPSLPGLPARPFRVTVPYGLYAFANTHALALYEASDIFRKATMQLAAAAGGGDGTQHAQLSSVKVVPAATVCPLLVVNVMHHVATTPVPLRLGRALRPSVPVPSPEHDHLKEQHPVQQASLPNAARGPTPPSASRKRPRMSDGDAEGSKDGLSGAAPGAEVSSRQPTADVQWPHGLASPELALCVDHLLHGRSIAVYGIGSKYYFLHHVAQSTELKHFHIVTVDASLGRGDGGLGSSDSIDATSTAGDPHGGGQRGRRSGGGHGTNAPAGAAAAPSIVRQLTILGNTLVKRARATALDAERQLPRHNTMLLQRQPQQSGAATEANTYPAARAALAGEATRSPAVARDVTAAMQRVVAASGTATTHVEVVDVDDALSSSSSSSEEWERVPGTSGKSCDLPDNGELVAAMPARDPVCEVGQSPTSRSTPATAMVTAGMSTPNKATVKSQPHQRCPPSTAVLARTPSSQRGTQLGGGGDASASVTPSLSLMSPVPAFFEVLQRTVTGSLGSEGDAGAEKDGGTHSTPPRSVCVELSECAGHLHSLKLPPLPVTASSPGGGTASDVAWRAPLLRFSSDAVRQLVLKSVRRRQASRRCVQWGSLPSTMALGVLAEQLPSTAASAPAATAPPRLHLSEAHRLRPGWSPPVLLVLHNVDLMNTEEAGLLLQLCAEFAHPQPHLQLLLSFDDPRWPLTPLAGALTQLGVCAVQLRSLLLPRVHEMQHVNSLRLLTEAEAVAAGGSGSLGLKAMGHGAPRAMGAGGLATVGSMGGSGGGSHLLQDTMRRVLFSLPPAFSSLLRILIDVQEETGEEQKISVFVAKERFEQHGIMVSQGRLKALLQELTSNRIAQYDMAEHALTVMQPRKLRKVLEEVAAQRDGAAAAASATGSSESSALRTS
ncbi:hypothetical protein, conserved [Leishmania tarentolae]|uniref:Uncharacterized protein n=1 Tax=Leishmania tarentolae TaxID=5689 RepID=A0A640K8D8_LEITA|nr:hypothetical protein, conserved [Leishmania tarentolae]